MIKLSFWLNSYHNNQLFLQRNEGTSCPLGMVKGVSFILFQSLDSLICVMSLRIEQSEVISSTATRPRYLDLANPSRNNYEHDRSVRQLVELISIKVWQRTNLHIGQQDWVSDLEWYRRHFDLWICEKKVRIRCSFFKRSGFWRDSFKEHRKDGVEEPRKGGGGDEGRRGGPRCCDTVGDRSRWTDG